VTESGLAEGSRGSRNAKKRRDALSAQCASSTTSASGEVGDELPYRVQLHGGIFVEETQEIRSPN
jgi:hypothetical protein